MHCPEHLAFKSRNCGVMLWLYWKDVPRDTIPLRVWLNPLRYELSVRAFGRRRVLNREGMVMSRYAFKLRAAWCGFSGGHKPKAFGRGSVCEKCWKTLPTPPAST